MESNNQIVEISKDFKISRDKLYKAWIEPEQLKKWWKPMNNHLVDVINHVEPKGEVKYIFQTDDHKDSFTIAGEYLEVQEHEKLVYTWNWNSEEKVLEKGDYKLTVEFVDKGENSTIKVKQENFKQDEPIKPHQEGWEKQLNEFAQYLEGNSPENNSSTPGAGIDNSQNKQSQTANTDNKNLTGYNEVPEQEKVGGYSS